MQLPPLYSALKMNGKPLYEYAREGKEIPRQIEKRPVEVEKLELVEWMEGGSHEHKFPNEEAGAPEKDVAEKVWQLEKDADGQNSDLTEARKRKFEQRQDELVRERPSKRKSSTSESDIVMSGGLQTPRIVKEEKVEKDYTVNDVSNETPGPPAAKLRMTVTSGFYVRSLCHDLGEAVGSRAIMAELIRTRQGQFQLGSNVLEYTDLAKGEDVWSPKVQTMLEDWSADQRDIRRPDGEGIERTESMAQEESLEEKDLR